MLGHIVKDIAWEKLGPMGAKWELVDVAQANIPSWESFWSDQRTLWGADKPGQKRVQRFFGVENAEEKLLAASRKKYDELKAYLLIWKGLYNIGDTLQVIPQSSNVMVLSKDWKGYVSDYSDLEIWLKEEKLFYWRRVRFCCEIFSFGTRIGANGDFGPELTGPAGGKTVSHRRGAKQDENETVTFNQQERMISIGDATFRMLE